MGEYYGYDEIVAFMRRVHAAIPTQSRLFSIGKTIEGRDTWGLEVIV